MNRPNPILPCYHKIKITNVNGFCSGSNKFLLTYEDWKQWDKDQWMAKERHKKTQQISVAFPETAPVNRTLSDTFKINNSCILKVNSDVYANHVVQATSRDYINPIKIKIR
jgi:hypothetical protein